MKKTSSEINFLRTACELTSKIFTTIIPQIIPKMTEKGVAILLQRTALDFGISQLSFNSIVVSGERTALPHGTPSDKELMLND
jgi:Xaa-Pro aminopeptidase